MSSWRALVLVFLPGLLGMRDPFQMPEDACSASQLSQWHYRGRVVLGEQVTGLVLDAAGKWRRLSPGQRLDNQWTVTGISQQQIDITLNPECEPSQWHWAKEGTNHDPKDFAGATAGDDSRRSEGKNRQPGGR